MKKQIKTINAEKEYIRKLDFISVINSWCENYLYKISLEWKDYMNTIIESNKDTIDGNELLIKEYEQKMKFIIDKKEEEKIKKEKLFLELKLAEKDYSNAQIPPMSVKYEEQFFEINNNLKTLKEKLADETDLTKKNILEKEIKKVQKNYDRLEQQHLKYLSLVKKRKEARNKMNEAEKEYKEYLEYYKNTKYTQTYLNSVEKTLQIYENIRDYNSKVLFDDAPKFRNEFEKKLISKDSVVQFSKKIFSLLKSVTNNQLYSGEFSDAEIQLILFYFAEEMERYSIKGFNFLKNALLDYQRDVSKDKIIKMEFNKIPFQKFLSAIIHNFSAQLNGALHHALDRFIQERNNTTSIHLRTNNDENKDLTFGDRLLPEDKLESGTRIYNDNVVDIDTKDLFDEIKKYILQNKESIAKSILKQFRFKLPPKSMFYNPKPRHQQMIINAVVTIINDLGEEIMKGNYVSSRFKNIVIDALGGAENSGFINTEVNIIRNILKYESIKYMIEKIDEATKKNEASLSEATERLYRFLELAKTKSINDIKQEPKIAKQFVKPKEMAQKLMLESSFNVQNKIDFLLNDKKDTSKDEAKSNTKILRSPLRTQRDY